MKYFFVYTLIFCALNLSAQDSFLSKYLSLDKQVYFEKGPEKPQAFKYAFCPKTNEFAFTFFSIKQNSDTVQFFIYDIDTDSIFEESFFLTGIRTTLELNYYKTFLSISLSENYICINTYSCIYLINRKTKEINKTEKLDLTYDGSDFLSEDKLVLYRNYNSQKKKNTCFTTFSIPEVKQIKHIKPNFDCIQYTHMAPNHWISALNGKVLFSNTLNYDIKIFDNDLTEVGSINKPTDSNWTSLSKHELKKIVKKKGGVPAIKEILKYENKIKRIRGAYWISDSTIIVNTKKGLGKKNNSYSQFSFDLWKFQNKKWKLVEKDLIDLPINDIEISNDEFSLFGAKYGSDYIFTNKHVFLLTFMPKTSLKNTTTSKFIETSNHYLFDSNPTFQIIKFKHLFNE